MAQPLVTAITCTYNREEFLRETLNAMLNQTYPNMEIIVVDDASTNAGMLAILDSYGDRIRVIRRTCNSGTCELPRYQGVAHAKGKYCAFCDSDDLWASDKIMKQVAWMEAHPEYPLCHTYAHIIDDHGNVQYLRHDGVLPPSGPCAKALLQHCFVSISSIMVHPKAWLDAQREEEIVELSMEWDFLLNIARDHPFGFIPEPLSSYRHSEEGITKKSWKWRPRDIPAFERILRKKLWRGIALRKEFIDLMIDAYTENADYHREHGTVLHAAYFCLRGLRHRPFEGALQVRLLKAFASPFWRKV